MTTADPHLAGLSDDRRQLLESWLLDFDLSWDEGRLSSWLAKLPPAEDDLRRPALVEMVKIDLERRWQRGERAHLEAYVQALPELGAVESLPADLIQAEYEARRACGAAADLDEFARRFPRQANELRWLVSEAEAASRGTSTPHDAPTPLSGLPAGPAVALPETFGRYRIVRKLGQGSMGTVYLAHDGQLDRQVALKVPRFSASDDREMRQRFLSEARSAATIEHPNICPVYDVGEIDGTPYLTMAYLEGQPLTRLFQGATPMSARAVAALVAKLALALQEAHNRGIIHRDLKPSNIMINQRGEPVILDFGLARRLHQGDARLTLNGQPLGTPAYMSPEQVVGAVEIMGPGSDVYCLGVILYQLLTRRLPFEGSVAEVLGQIVTRLPEPPSKYRTDLDPRLEAICLKALSKEVAGRYATMREFAAALAGFVDSGRETRGWRVWLHRKRLPLAIAAGATAVLALLAAILLWNANPTGSVRIELDDPNAEVEVQVDGEAIDSARLNEPLRFSVGQHNLLITGRNIQTVDTSFTVGRGENPAFPVKLVPKPARRRHHDDDHDDHDKRHHDDDDDRKREPDDDPNDD
jgi:predicted Ser/Thr protein kinase